MPIFEFECPVCHSRAEEFRHPGEVDEPAPYCASARCQTLFEDDAQRMRRVISAPAGRFPGADTWRAR